MKSSLLIIAVSGFALAACASTGTNAPQSMSFTPKVTDADMSCTDLKVDLASLDAVIEESKATADNNGSAVAADATSAAVRYGAARSGATTVPGLGAAINLFDNANRQKIANDKKKAEEKAQEAEMRHSRLTGLYEGKNCAAQTEPEVEASEDESAV